MSWKLPTSLTIGGVVFCIRTDYRAVLDILMAFNDPDLPDYARTQVMIEILYENWKDIPTDRYQEAAEKACWFIDCGGEQDKRRRPKMIDWEQDADLIAPAINKVAGIGDIRSLPYLHWWTFMGYFMEIGEGLLSSVLNIRYKRSHNKKLEKWERDFYRENRKIIDFRVRLSEEEQAIVDAEKKALEELFG